ncbi:hypothetical protein C8J57DRAFT_1371327 [Mycena rebaudengoi]|nr:hypothetical protein C8J57DRAFT_1371327 [Mycena rebaudengoi]
MSSSGHSDVGPNAETELHAIPCPALTLPPELTCEIFARCLSPQRRSLDWVFLSPTQLHRSTSDVPMVLASVCQTWRSIALSMHTLWTSLTLELTGSRDELLTAFLDMWLPRCGEQPLALYLKYSGGVRSYLCSDEIIERISASAPQWKTAYLSLQPYDLERLNDQLEGRLPLLEALAVDTLDGRTSSPSAKITIFRTAPALRQVNLFKTLGFFDPTDLPLAKLTRFVEGRYNFTGMEVLTMLLSTPLMGECQVSLELGKQLFTTVHWRSEPILLPCLHTLILYNRRSSAIHSTFLQCLTAPALHTIELTLSSHLHCTNFISFVSRSACRISSATIRFSLGFDGSLDDAVQRCLGAMSALTHLHLQFDTNPVNPMQLFTALLRDSAVALPLLASVDLTMQSPPLDGDHQTLVDLLAVRWRATSTGNEVSRLEAFHLRATAQMIDPPSAATVEQLQSLVAEGMDLSIVCADESWLAP